MALSLYVYRIDGTIPVPIQPKGMDEEKRLQDILATRLDIIAEDLLLIGREVRTDWDSRVDLLALNSEGQLVVIELKRNQTPREVVAQTLEYGSWVGKLSNTDIAEIYSKFLAKYHPEELKKSLDEAFQAKFGFPIPDELNAEHELLIVASELDAGTERIVEYLTESHGVPINVVFFRVFHDNGQEYLTRAWLREPGESGDVAPASEDGAWNGECYANFGEGDARSWDDATKYNFISAGGGDWYTKPLRFLKPGSRVWVNVPGYGYAGVAQVKEEALPVSEFKIDGKPFLSLPHKGSYHVPAPGHEAESSEKVVPVEWIHKVPLSAAVREKGFFGIQTTVALSRKPKWQHTVDRLKLRWEIKD